MSKKNRRINEKRETGLQIKEKNENPLRPIRIGLLGDTRVGKTSIINSFIGMEFRNDLYDTIGSDKFDKKVKLNDGNEIKLVFWDTSGQERFRAAALITLKTVEGIILVFDITDKNSFNNIERWFKDVKDSCVKEPIIILFGNKVELDKEIWKVSMEEIEGLVKKYNWDYFLISAKNNISIEQGFNCIANKIYNKRIKE